MLTRLFLLLCLLSLSVLPVSAEIYRWVDAEGRVVYGDDPPAKSKAKPVNLPQLTVADSYAPQTDDNAASNPPAAADAAADSYSDFKITAPVADEALRSNDGSLTVTVALQPALKAGDSIALYLDGKQIASGTHLSFNLTDIERGEHSLFAVLSDAQGNIIQNTETVKFSLLRHSVLNK